jgi:hypothetical protein
MRLAHTFTSAFIVRTLLLLATIGIAPLASAQTHYRLIRTEVLQHIAGEQPETSVVKGRARSLTITTRQASFTSSGTLSVTVPDRVSSDQQQFTIRAKIDGSWNLRNTTTNINLGLQILGVPKGDGKGDPGPWLQAGSHSFSIQNEVRTAFGPDSFVKKWIENGKRYRSFSIGAHTGVVQTLSKVGLTFVYEESTDALKPEMRTLGVQVLEVTGDVTVSPGGDNAGTLRVKAGGVLGEWDRMITAPDSTAKLRFPDGSVMQISGLADIRVAANRSAGNLVQTRIWIRGGQISITNNSTAEIQITTPTAVAAARGTQFTVRHDKLSGLTAVSAMKGSVKVTPVNPSIKPFDLPAGQQVQVSLDQARRGIPR